MAIAGFVLLAAIAAFFLFVPTKQPVKRTCPACAGVLADRGFVSWNGGASGDLNMVTTGGAAPSEAFVARLREAAKLAPTPSARMVGALTLLACTACSQRFVDEQGAGMLACEPEQWAELTRGAT